MTVNLLTDDAATWMVPLFRTRREYFLTKYNCALTAGEPQTQTSGEDELVTSYLTRPKAWGRVMFRLLTPTTFKTKGRYAVFPTAALILHSAAAKWNALG